MALLKEKVYTTDDIYALPPGVRAELSRRMDYYTKLAEYKEAGVREYWIVDPCKKYVIVYDLEHEEVPMVCPLKGRVKAGIYEDLEIDFSEMKI